MPGCSRLSRKGASSEKARFCTRHGGGRPCRYHGCRVASRGLLGFCYKHRHHSGHCFDSKSSCDGLNSQSRYRPPATNNQMSRQSNGWRCDQPGESGLTLPFTESSLMDDLGRCTSISLGTSEVDKTPEKTSAEYMAFTFDSSYDHASFLNLDELFCVPSALLSLEESLWLTATTPLKY
ncbi:hypothetical protein Pmar_PMAR011656 [Perkinsus marinus ATCC 50983]|uniref:Uncharacterized protein n=1 Tax=Perkinsus marinus (strain ATCC 50983 / TXsc) TaxID=423536 RepID=C5LCE5_PERM5|nr:hypothetical protein Pmar_PMAR011656 [Perkinsus marinus ATCC 50983]EER05628.1 hypothetical protein Pmar_PMAR011656 [Perkinsus marinus ATCC 50983]|eukprot:XP_002773812.1 hypothetical protein Pmar_PMAR011656 [Perkinsus marinus ATCC 50983]